MVVVFNVNMFLQISAIIASCFGIIACIVNFFYIGSFAGFICVIFSLILCILLLLVELYVFDFFKYFGFLFKMWGKGALYFFVGGLLYGPSGFPLACAIIFWIVACASIVASFFFHTVNPPLLQSNYTPDLAANSNDYFPPSAQAI